MSFVMLADKSKQKVKCLNEDGSEIYEDVDPYAFLRFQEAGLLRPAKKPKHLGTSDGAASLPATISAQCQMRMHN